MVSIWDRDAGKPATSNYDDAADIDLAESQIKNRIEQTGKICSESASDWHVWGISEWGSL